MSENGEPKKSVTGEVLSLLEDQMDLAALEFQYETGQGARRIAALIAAAFLGLTAFVILQVALVFGLVKLGLSVPIACLLLAAIYATGAGVLVAKWGTRDKRAGEPFQGTREEIHKNLRWIRQIFS